ncbi:Cytochrome P450 [Trinorchestia longiramus]|nr:Cytochrome P450 [Trinorchestia longiramus]
MPPGSFGLPILGELPPRGVPISKHLSDLKQKLGSVYTTKWGSHPIVVITDFNLMKKAFNHPDLQGRPQFFSFQIFNFFKNIGVINSDGPRWVENRRFLLRHLRDLGMGRTTLEDSIHDEAAMLVDHLEKTCVDKPTVMDVFINGAVVNVIWQMLASKRHDINDEEMLQYNRSIEEIVNISQTRMFLLDFFPILGKILPNFILNNVMKLHVVVRIREEFYHMFRGVIKDHLKSLDVNSPRDIIDQYLTMQPDRDASGYLNEDDEHDLLAMMADMFTAGSETTSSTLRWMILYLATFPEVQAKVHKSLDEVVPTERLPSLNDRSQLQYVDAMLLDVLRLSSLAPISLIHRAMTDVTFEGYTIPTDTSVLICAELCHRDPALWKEPNKLYPEHFLDKDGNLDSKKDGFLPFSVGRRQCLGESLARMELFLFSSAILQRFTIELPGGVSTVPESDPGQIIFNIPPNKEVILRKRL